MTPPEQEKTVEYFQPLQLVEELEDDYLRYLLTTFPVSGNLKDTLYERFRNDASLWEGPFITISQPYKKGIAVKSMLTELAMNIELAQLMPPYLYKHQEEAIRNIISGRNTIITTGTGSGKTEGFLLPILDYCIKHDEKGVKAILLYPMNSLAEDQADRLRKYLYLLTPKLKRRPITFARYTGGTPTKWDETKIGPVRCPMSDMINTEGLRRCNVCSGKQAGSSALYPQLLPNNKKVLACAHESPSSVIVENEALTREDIRNSLPDILITNYKMLDLLLMRKEDKDIFSGSLCFVVVDELHSYLGAQGTELACLLRRLISRIKRSGGRDPIFIGASATIVSDSATNIQKKAAEYATGFFGAPVAETDVVCGEVEPRAFTGDAWAHTVPEIDPGINIEDSSSSFQKILLSICPPSQLPSELPEDIEERKIVLGTLMQRNKLFRELITRLKQPKALRDIEEEIKDSTGDTYNRKEILRVLTLATKAYEPSSARTSVPMPLIRCQVHFVCRTIDGIYKCTSCKTLFFSPRQNCPACHGTVETLGVCRSCGAEFLRIDLAPDIYRRYIARHTEEIDRALNDETPWSIPKSSLMFEPYGFSASSIWLSESEIPSDRTAMAVSIERCTSCGTLKHNNPAPCCSSPQLKPVWMFRKISSCPFCLDQQGPFIQPVSTFYLSPKTAAPTLFTLAHSLTKDAEHRKQLIFADSRQETARLAGFIDDLHRGLLVRNLIYNVISNSHSQKPVSFFEISRRVCDSVYDLGYKDDPEDEILGLDRQKLERQIFEELAGCFNKRYGVEKVGLIKAIYDVIDQPQFAIDYQNGEIQLLNGIRQLTKVDAATIRDILAVILDHMRHEGGMKCLREFRPWGTRPAAFVEQMTERRQSLYYSVTSIKRKSRPRGGFYNHTTFTKFIEKSFGTGDAQEQNEVLGELFRYLQSVGLLTNEQLGQRRGSANRGSGWMVDESKVSFVIPENISICSRCGERWARSDKISCFTYRCEGRGTTVSKQNEILAEDDIYIKRYTERKPVRLITAEDHGGLEDATRKKIESSFKQGQIDIICCTPTLELGVDIGDLSIVGLYRAPPSPANYLQRVGRAGRKEKISLAISFFGQNPIDQYYRKRPLEMISGNIRMPYVNLENDTVVSRHIRSLIFEELTVTNENFLLNRRVLEFKNQSQANLLKEALKNNLEDVKKQIQSTYVGIPWLRDWRIDSLCNEFPRLVEEEITKWGARRNLLLSQMDVYEDKRREANRAGRSEEANDFGRRFQELQYQLNEMQTEEGKEADLFTYLSGVGVLPTYTFPTKSVRIQDRWGKDLGNDRPACSSLTEYAPGLNVDMRKTKYRVRGFETEANQEPEGRTFFICDNEKGGCGRYVSDTMPNMCPECKSGRERITEVKAWAPRALVLDREERISVRGDDEYKSADVEYFLSQREEGSVQAEHKTSWATLEDIGYSWILYLVRRTSDMSERVGFDICTTCGWCMQGEPAESESTNHNKLMDRRSHCNGRVEKRSLWHKFRTNAIILKPNLEDISGNDARRWLITLKNALCRTAEIIINAAEGELDGFVLNNSLVIFDNVDGGVGYTRQVINRIGEIEREMALTILSCDCETGCPKCIFSSRRKIDIIRGEVDKKLLIPLCQKIIREFKKSKTLPPLEFRQETAFEGIGAKKVEGRVSCWFSAINDKKPGTWLRDIILTAKQEICVTSLYITDDTLEWEDSGNSSFAELLSLAAGRGVKVRVIVRPPSSDKHKRILRRLKENGVDIRLFSRPTELGLDAIAHCKMVIVDGDLPSETSAAVTLSANLSAEVQKNVDFFCLGYEKTWVSGLQDAFAKIWADTRLA